MLCNDKTRERLIVSTLPAKRTAAATRSVVAAEASLLCVESVRRGFWFADEKIPS
jgi:hypothetical protein